MKKPTHEERLHRRRSFAEAIHEYSFYVSLAFTVLFFWELGGGKPVWIGAFVAMGVGIDYTKKTQLDLAAVTVDKKERRLRKFVALLMTAFSLLAGLGSSLLRVNAVASAEAALADTSALDAQIAIWQAEYDVQINQVNTSTRVEWRDTSQAKADNARSEILRLTLERDALVREASEGERAADMFGLLARFFHSSNPDSFMVLLLMLAVLSVEVSLWVTAPQYWKDRVEELAEQKRQEEQAKEEARRQALARQELARRAAAARQAAPRTAAAEPVLSEKVLVVQPPRKPAQGSLFD